MISTYQCKFYSKCYAAKFNIMIKNNCSLFCKIGKNKISISRDGEHANDRKRNTNLINSVR